MIIGVLRAPMASCISGMLNASFFDDCASVSLALFSQDNALAYFGGAQDSWAAIASCTVNSDHTDCTFSSESLGLSLYWYVALIFETPTVTTLDYIGGYYTATFQGLTPGEQRPSATAYTVLYATNARHALQALLGVTYSGWSQVH